MKIDPIVFLCKHGLRGKINDKWFK